MEPKKNPKVDLEAKRQQFFQIGLLASLLLVIVAFEWSSRDDTNYDLGDLVVSDEIEMDVPPTKQEKKPPPPPPPPKLEVVEDETVLEDQPVLEDTEIDEDVAIEIEEEPEEEEEPDIFMVVEQMPEFPGGVQAMYKFLYKNIKYPPLAKENDITGKVFIKFVVTSKGRVEKAHILKGIGGGCDEEALRVVNMMPSWNAGKQRGKPVNVWFTLPIKFTLQ
ncbi:MAG: energy transducer TonB [Bacteroidetes bacterium]|nr:MAG: energy transducer TonB [Bacteroidota bacterium]